MTMVHEKVYISKRLHLWFTLKQELNHFLSKYLCKIGIVENPEDWALNI